MTPSEYVQLKAFARQDGAMLALVWIISFFCYIKGLTSPMLGLVAVAMLAGSPVLVAVRLRHFRDYARDGVISFLRGYAFSALTFFYGGLLLALAGYGYFAFMDKGFVTAMLSETLNSEQGRQFLRTYGMEDQAAESLSLMRSMRPIDFALNMLSMAISAGCLIGLPIAAVTKRSEPAKAKSNRD